MKLTARFAAFVDWLRSEPVVVSYVSALAVTALAHWGIQLSDPVTFETGAAATAIATWAARQQVTPWRPPVDVVPLIPKKMTAKKSSPPA